MRSSGPPCGQPAAAPREHGLQLASAPRPRSDAPMLLHLTPLEAPIVWIAFAAGVAMGAVGTFLLMARRFRRS